MKPFDKDKFGEYEVTYEGVYNEKVDIYTLPPF